MLGQNSLVLGTGSLTCYSTISWYERRLAAGQIIGAVRIFMVDSIKLSVPPYQSFF